MTDFLLLTEDEKRGLKTPLCRTPVSDLLQFAAQFLPVGKNCSSSSELRSHVADFIHFQASQESSLACFPSQATDIRTTCGPVESNSIRDVTSSDQLPSDRPDASSTFGYPPMPAAAPHVSVVQERILRASSAAAAASAAVIAASAGSPPSPASADSVATATDDRSGGALSSMTAVVVSCDDSAADAESASEQRNANVLPTSTISDSDVAGGSSATRVRLTTPRRSRVVARFGIVPGQETATTPSQSWNVSRKENVRPQLDWFTAELKLGPIYPDHPRAHPPPPICGKVCLNDSSRMHWLSLEMKLLLWSPLRCITKLNRFKMMIYLWIIIML